MQSHARHHGALPVLATLLLAGCSLIDPRSRPDPEAQNVWCTLEYAPVEEGGETSVDLRFRASSSPYNEEAFYMSLPDDLLHVVFAPGRHLRSDMVVEGATCSERPWSSGTRLPMMRPLKTLRCKRHGLDRVVFAVETKWGRCSQEIAAGDATPQYLGWETQSASPIADEVVFATRAAAPLAHEVAAGNGADEPPAWDRRWYELLAENDRRLRAGDWSTADREAQRLLRGAVERSPPRRAAFTGVSQAAYQRAIALTGLGRLEEARWFAVIARAFDGRILSIMAYRHGQQEYGEHGRQVDAWIREAVSHWEAVPPVSVTCASEEPEPGFVPPAKRSGEPPVDRGAPDEEGGDFGAAVVSFVVDEEGVPRFPDIDMKQLYNARIDHLWATVEAVREWRFEPARRDGEPVPCRYTVAAAFHPHGS